MMAGMTGVEKLRMALYSDVNQTDPFERQRLTDEDAVQQALRNLLRTRKGERVFHPEYGMDIDHLLFELIDGDIALDIEVSIKEAIIKWEPRVRVINISVVDDPDSNTYRMTMLYQIKGLEGRNFEFSESLSAGVGAS